MKIKLFTHTDFDGLSAGILAKIAFGDNVDIEYCEPNETCDNYIDKKVREFFFSQEVLEYNRIYITDLSIQEDLAKEIDICMKGTCCLPQVVLIDHHPTALELNKYNWCSVIVDVDGEKVSGTSLFYSYLLSNRILQKSKYWNEEFSKNLFDFVEIVRKYDTWLWSTKYNDGKPKMWNDLLYIMGREEFIETVLYRLSHYDVFDFCDFDLKLLKYKQRDIDAYLKSKQSTIIEKDILGYKTGIIFAEQFHSEIGNRLAQNNPHLDFIVLINIDKSVSYRGIKESINLGKDIAQIYNGGGHPMSAGSPLAEDIRKKIISMIFDKENLYE